MPTPSFHHHPSPLTSHLLTLPSPPQLITALTTFVPHTTEPLVATALRLLFNLSFDAQLRSAIVSPTAGFLPKLASLLKRKQQLPLVLRLLYNVSAEEEARQAIGASDTPRVVMKQVLQCTESQLPLELAALAINLAADPKGATAMACVPPWPWRQFSYFASTSKTEKKLPITFHR